MMNAIKLAILASGNGSNAEILVKKARLLNLEVVGIFCDKEGAFVLERARQLEVPYELILPLPKEKREDFDRRLWQRLKEYEVKWVFLAGYMRLLSKEFLHNFFDPSLKQNRVINIHPSLLPSFPGVRAYEEAFEAGVGLSGVTVHFVDEGIDTGKIIKQKSFPRFKDDSLETFKRRGQNLEHFLYPQVLEELLSNIKGKTC